MLFRYVYNPNSYILIFYIENRQCSPHDDVDDIAADYLNCAICLFVPLGRASARLRPCIEEHLQPLMRAYVIDEEYRGIELARLWDSDAKDWGEVRRKSAGTRLV